MARASAGHCLHTCVCCPASYARMSIAPAIPYSAADLFGFNSLYEYIDGGF